ncbi:unnamed protein product [Peronospora belbahrii]|uniref:Uncharacterized protein n=1 Tax=Peronospora belbahrii TaxID=622444 RepID=A0ABN8CWM0_9STRA|nr:unnamed protein product [Peronospora belbahrii]
MSVDESKRAIVYISTCLQSLYIRRVNSHECWALLCIFSNRGPTVFPCHCPVKRQPSVCGISSNAVDANLAPTG